MTGKVVLLVMKEVALIAGLSYAGLCVFVALFQSRYVYYPQSRLDATPAMLGMNFEEVVISEGIRGTVHAWWIPGAMAEAPAVMICHGNAGNISHRIYLARVFNEWGWHVLLFDYRGYGQSSGRPSERRTYEDAMAAWQWLVSQHPQTGGRIVYGRSLGGAVAAWLAARETPDALIIESSFTSALDMARRMFPFLPARLLLRYKYDTIGNLGNAKSPVMIAHSPDDEMISFENAELLYEAVATRKELVRLSGGHNDGGLEDNRIYQQRLRSFVEQALQDRTDNGDVLVTDEL